MKLSNPVLALWDPAPFVGDPRRSPPIGGSGWIDMMGRHMNFAATSGYG